MDRRLFVVLCAALLLTSQAAASQSGSASLPDIGLGYGPQSIVPVASGTPVLTQGDNLWAQSYESAASLTLIMISPAGAPSPFVDLPPGGLVSVYTFLQTDPAGVWTLEVFSGQSVVSVKLTVADGNASLTPAPTGAGLSKGSVVLGYSLPATSAYGIQACLLGSQGGATTTLRLPPSSGGSIEASLNDSAVTVQAPSTISPVPAWFELYAPRAFSNGTGLVSAEVLAARTQLFSLGASQTPVGVPLTNALVFRDGRYDLRTFVRTAAGLVSFDTPYLRENSSTWISLAGCSDLAEVTSGNFELSAKLNGSAASWPRELIMMYDVQGVESFREARANATEARIDLGNASQAVQLSKVTATLAGAGLGAWGAYNGSLYLLADRFPLSLEVRLSFENVTTETLPVDVPSAFWVGSLQVPFGEVNVSAASGGSPISNATILVAPSGAPAASLNVGKSGNASLVLPPGEYNFTLTQGGRSVSEVVQLAPGETVVARLDLGAEGAPYLTYLLAAVLAVGAGVDAVVWRAYFRRRAAFR